MLNFPRKVHLILNASRSNSSSTTESSESRAQENNENPVIKAEEVKKVRSHGNCTFLPLSTDFFLLLDSTFIAIFQEEPSQKTAPDAGTEASPVKRRGRPPKSAATAPVAADKEVAAAPVGGGTGRGRKRAADPNSTPSAESINIKMSKQQQQNDEGTKRQIDLQR